MTSGVHKCSVVSNDVKNPLHFEAFWVAFATPPFKLTYFFLPAPSPSSSISLLTPAPHSSTLFPKAQKRTDVKVYRKVSGSLPEKLTGNLRKFTGKVYRKNRNLHTSHRFGKKQTKNRPTESLPETFLKVSHFPLAPSTGVIFFALAASPGATPEAFFHVEEPRPKAFSDLWGLLPSARSSKTSAENFPLGWRVASCNLQQRSNLLFGSVRGSNAGTGPKWSGALGSDTAWYHSSGTR